MFILGTSFGAAVSRISIPITDKQQEASNQAPPIVCQQKESSVTNYLRQDSESVLRATATVPFGSRFTVSDIRIPVPTYVNPNLNALREQFAIKVAKAKCSIQTDWSLKLFQELINQKNFFSIYINGISK